MPLPPSLHALRSLRPDTEAIVCSLPAVHTPALIVDEEVVGANIDAMIRLIGSAERWRVHCKTTKSERTMKMLLGRGVRRFKASTLIEVASLLRAGASDVLYAVSTVGPAQHQLIDLAQRHPRARVHALLDSRAALQTWAAGPIGYFLDVDTGMHRSGVPVTRPEVGRALVDEASALGLEFCGLHHYDGHLASVPELERTRATENGLALISEFATALEMTVPELVTGGTHTFLPALGFDFPGSLADCVTVGPGTIVYCDLRSLEKLGDIGFRPAVAVVCRVIASAAAHEVTVDAGVTAIQVDSGFPHAAVSGEPGASVRPPSQEHLVIEFPDAVPSIGQLLVLVPLHVDTTVAQFDQYIALDSGGVVGVFPVSARGHPAPLTAE